MLGSNKFLTASILYKPRRSTVRRVDDRLCSLLQALPTLFVAVGGVCLCTPLPALALPFNPDPESFKSWLNANPQRYKNGDQYYFYRLEMCSHQEYSNKYICWNGMARIVDPRGTSVCHVTAQWWGDHYLDHPDGARKLVKGDGLRLWNISGCRWQ